MCHRASPCVSLQPHPLGCHFAHSAPLQWRPQPPQTFTSVPASFLLFLLPQTIFPQISPHSLTHFLWVSEKHLCPKFPPFPSLGWQTTAYLPALRLNADHIRIGPSCLPSAPAHTLHPTSRIGSPAFPTEPLQAAEGP